jgi:Ca-activated chloride channel homolog
MKRSNVNKQLAALVALGVVFTACGGDDDGGDAEESAPTEEASEDGLFGDGGGGEGGDAEDDLVTEPAPPPDEPIDAEAPIEEPSEEPADELAEEPAEEQEASAADDASLESTDDGLFGEEAPADREAPEPGDVDSEARFDDNRFEDYGYRSFIDTDVDPLSTFALDVDTGSYSIARRWLDEGSLPPRESVRPEEFINAFDYDYDTPRSGLDISVDGGPSPFDDDNVLVRVGVQAEVVDDADRGDANLTFVIDTSGSMNRDDRLGLVKTSLSILVDELADDDRFAIVSYAGGASIVLEPTSVSDRDVILDALDDLDSTGGTNLQAGLALGYELARESFDDGGINRVVIASDGVANAGVTDPDQLAAMIRGDADNGIDLVTVGFGMGNFNDVTMEQLADQGDGFYAYVDTEDEAERLFEDELTSTLLTVAKDGKIQVEFDEDVVEAYRLIGFENRGVRDSDFRNDDVDAGELGAAHQVTAIYEIELARGVSVDDRAELGVVSLRWEDPESGDVVEIDEDIDMRDIEPNWADTPVDFQLATVVATFAEKLRDNPFADDVDLDDVASEAGRLADDIDTDEADELADLIELAARLS